jgi:hypothetical protein
MAETAFQIAAVLAAMNRLLAISRQIILLIESDSIATSFILGNLRTIPTPWPPILRELGPAKKFDWSCTKCVDALTETLDKMIGSNASQDTQIHEWAMTPADVHQDSSSDRKSRLVYHETAPTPSETGTEEQGHGSLDDQNRSASDTMSQHHTADHDFGQEFLRAEDTTLNCDWVWYCCHCDQENERIKSKQDHFCPNHPRDMPLLSHSGPAYHNGHWQHQFEDCLRLATKIMAEPAMMDLQTATETLGSSLLRQLIQTPQEQHLVGDWSCQHNTQSRHTSTYTPCCGTIGEATAMICF